jgi:hypothetical protein
MTAETVDATSRQVNSSIPVYPWPRRWSKVLAHLRSAHPETTPAGAPINPSRLAEWHRTFHQEDAWPIEESAHPHRHEGLLARWREAWEWRT